MNDAYKLYLAAERCIDYAPRIERKADEQPGDYSEPPMRRCICGAEFQYGPMCESCWAMQQESSVLQIVTYKL